MRKLQLSLAPILAFALWTSLAKSGPGDATRLVYTRSERAAECPDRAALEQAVSKRLGYNPFFAVARQSIVVDITDADSLLLARMQLVDERGLVAGSRELRDRAEHCEELVASLALAISIALDPSAALEPPPEPVGDEAGSTIELTPQVKEPWYGELQTRAPRTQETPEPERERPERKRPGSSPSRAVSVALRAGAFAGAGLGPAAALGFRLGVGGAWRWLRVTTEFADLSHSTRDESTWGGSVQASLVTASLIPCLAWRAFDACAVGQLGRLSAEGKGVESPAKHVSLWAALGARLEYAPLVAGHVRLLLNADALTSLTPVALQLRGKTVWATPRVITAAGAGAEVVF